jgi:hypothetical protein
MTCAEAIEALLEAEPTALEGIGGEPLARHIRECPSCAERARTILQGEAALVQALGTQVRALDLDQILERAGAAGPGQPTRLPAPWRSWSISRHRRTLLPLAAAAGMTALFLTREPSLPGPVYSPPPASQGLDVQVPEGRSVAVLETNNPEITVLWLF